MSYRASIGPPVHECHKMSVLVFCAKGTFLKIGKIREFLRILKRQARNSQSIATRQRAERLAVRT